MNWYPCWSYHIQNYQSLPTICTNFKQKIVVKNNLNGTGIRILLSHKYATDDIYYYDMAVVVNKQKYPLTVNQKTKIMLAPNQSVYSDVVNITIQAKDKIEITMKIQTEGPINGYVGLNSNQMIEATFYQGTKQITMIEDSAVLKTKFNQYVYYGIEAIEIATQKAPYVIAVFGDSLVHQGYWMNSLYAMLYQKYQDVVVYNEGISGNRLLKNATSSSSLNSIFGQAGVHRFYKDVYQRYTPDCVFLALGINDLVHPGYGCPLSELVNEEEMIAGYLSLQRKNLYLATISPFYKYNGIKDKKREETRNNINTWIKKQPHIDIATWVSDRKDTKRLAIQYDSGDHLHFNQLAGKKIAREIIKIIEGGIEND